MKNLKLKKPKKKKKDESEMKNYGKSEKIKR